ncbi:MAG: bifunctional hydroxymethylpyrimidine kinase/phosphomethylpyrimidine kinase [Caulobacterales bacterium]
MTKGRVLIIAGSDSGGGAGIQADIKTVTALGGYAMTAVTAITVQNTLGVTGVHAIPQDIIRGQIDAVMDDLGADAWKIGMLGSAETVRLVGNAAKERARYAPIVLDPVMIAKGGAPLLAPDAIDAIRAMMPIATLITPNAPEAAALTGMDVSDLDAQLAAAETLVKLGAKAALVKGGHIEGPIVRDVLMSADSAHIFETVRIETAATHGTGCTLASAIATGLAQGLALNEAVDRARAYLLEAIKAAPGFGNGHGPLGHGWPLQARNES